MERQLYSKLGSQLPQLYNIKVVCYLIAEYIVLDFLQVLIFYCKSGSSVITIQKKWTDSLAEL